jgi:regulatory protein
MDKEQALDRLRVRCSREEVCSGMALSLLKRWSTPRRGGSGGGQTGSLSERDMARIIATLVEEKFIDDNRFAGAFVRDKLKFNGWGKQKIVFKLRSLGVAADIIERALRENYYCEGGDCSDGECSDGDGNLSGQKVLERLLEKKWKSLKEDEPLQVRKAKAVRFAAGRGFEYGDIIAALAKIM